MRCAVFSVTSNGIALAEKLIKGCPRHSFDVYVKEGRKAGGGVFRYSTLKDAVAECFERYDALIFFSALGIAVRMIAPHLESKLKDPAVVVVDEAGRHAISVLSGHVGGANELTGEAAAVLGAEPVITTATDVNEIKAPDALASKLGMRPVPKSEIQTLNGTLVEGKEIKWAVDTLLENAEFYEHKLEEYGVHAEKISVDEIFKSEAPTVFLTQSEGKHRKGLLYLIPQRLIAGIGCRRGVSSELIRDALEKACAQIGQDITRVSEIASTVVKSDEAGLLELASSLGVKTVFFDNETLERTINYYKLPQSEFVKKQIGVGNICEAAALSAVKDGRTALPKTKYTKVTVALIWEK